MSGYEFSSQSVGFYTAENTANRKISFFCENPRLLSAGAISLN
jgi:hypothetical protein